LIAAICTLLIGAIFVVEVLTPDDVVGAFALLPLLAALWVLSSRPATVVVAVAALFFGVTVAIEPTNRTTVGLLGLAVFITALVARVYATGLASLLSGRRHIRPSLTSWVPPAIVDEVDRSSLVLRSLTRRELEVARLAAEGHTTPEIGRHLHIGNRTVESHLASAYSKLQIRSRLQLIRMASVLGAPPTV
jgi:DNA-binding CsgD family transcriptional regulator